MREREREREREGLFFFFAAKEGLFFIFFGYEFEEEEEIVATLSVWVREMWNVCEWVAFLILLCERTLVYKLGQKDKIERERNVTGTLNSITL